MYSKTQKCERTCMGAWTSCCWPSQKNALKYTTLHCVTIVSSASTARPEADDTVDKQRACGYMKETDNSLASRDELAKLEHNSIQYIHLLPPSFLLSASEVAERVDLLLVCFAVPPLHLASFRIHHCTKRIAGTVLWMQPTSLL